MKLRYLFVFSLVALWLSSCTIQQHVHFNRDLSGKVTSTIDLSMLKTMMSQMPKDSGMNSMPMLNMGMMMDSLSKNPEMNKIKDIEGISNVQINMDKKTNVLTMSYEFKNIDALNRAMAQGGTGSPGGGMGMMGSQMPKPKAIKDFKYFTKKGRYITFRMPKSEVPKEMESGMKQNPMMSGEMMRFEYKISFERKIKRVKTENNIFKSDNYIEYKTNIEELMKEKKPLEVKIKYR